MVHQLAAYASFYPSSAVSFSAFFLAAFSFAILERRRARCGWQKRRCQQGSAGLFKGNRGPSRTCRQFVHQQTQASPCHSSPAPRRWHLPRPPAEQAALSLRLDSAPALQRACRLLFPRLRQGTQLVCNHVPPAHQGSARSLCVGRMCTLGCPRSLFGALPGFCSPAAALLPAPAPVSFCMQTFVRWMHVQARAIACSALDVAG